MRVVMWGTWDRGKPRNRILLNGLRGQGVEVIECHADVWSNVEDKTQIHGFGAKLVRSMRWLLAYPGLIVRYLRLPSHDAVLVGYLGQVDVLVIGCFARMRSAPVIWDAFLSLHDTVMADRGLVGRRHPVAMALYLCEWLACRVADQVVLDTRAHGAMFVEQFGLSPERVSSVLVGAELDRFPATARAPDLKLDGPTVHVLFYGQFIPLHGIETIVQAMRLARDEDIHWTLIGQGQEAGRIRDLLDASPLERVEWVDWVPYDTLTDQILHADVCLGIFGGSGKAGRVIPNKVFQILAAGAPLVTRDSPAIRELLGDAPSEGVILVPAEDPESLLAAIRELHARSLARPLHGAIRHAIGPEAIGRAWVEVLQKRIAS
jgi:glycosyltransferase involved in cell wall biosynthesis